MKKITVLFLTVLTLMTTNAYSREVESAYVCSFGVTKEIARESFSRKLRGNTDMYTGENYVSVNAQEEIYRPFTVSQPVITQDKSGTEICVLITK